MRITSKNVSRQRTCSSRCWRMNGGGDGLQGRKKANLGLSEASFGVPIRHEPRPARSNSVFTGILFDPGSASYTWYTSTVNGHHDMDQAAISAYDERHPRCVDSHGQCTFCLTARSFSWAARGAQAHQPKFHADQRQSAVLNPCPASHWISRSRLRERTRSFPHKLRVQSRLSHRG